MLSGDHSADRSIGNEADQSSQQRREWQKDGRYREFSGQNKLRTDRIR